ncbi:MAG: hypothetical protein M0C28_25850 [Candidatus Moduliflexus flocculans]|nr:hypothetical protein [Candidatus Moduliflexus flocculans]
MTAQEDGSPRNALLGASSPRKSCRRLLAGDERGAAIFSPAEFSSFIQDLENEFAKRQKTRKIEAAEKAILVRVEKNPLAEAPDSRYSNWPIWRAPSGVEVFDSIVQYRPLPDPKFLVGRGKLSDIGLRATQIGANLLIFDHELTPAQVRSINDFTGLKVIDRTQVILDISCPKGGTAERGKFKSNWLSSIICCRG